MFIFVIFVNSNDQKKKVNSGEQRELVNCFIRNKEMAKDKKKGPKANVFKVAGAKSLKKTKAKAVNLGLKNIKQKVADIDKQFIEIKNKPKLIPELKKHDIKTPKKAEIKVTKEEVASAADKIVKMDL